MLHKIYTLLIVSFILGLSFPDSAQAATSLTVTAQSQDGSKTFPGLTFQCSQSNGSKPGSDGKIPAPTHSNHTTNSAGQFTWNAPGDGTVSCFIQSAPPECYYPLPRQVSSVSGGSHTYLFAYDEASCFINAQNSDPVGTTTNLDQNETIENLDPVLDLEEATGNSTGEPPAGVEDSQPLPADEAAIQAMEETQSQKPSLIQRILGFLRRLFL